MASNNLVAVRSANDPNKDKISSSSTDPSRGLLGNLYKTGKSLDTGTAYLAGRSAYAYSKAYQHLISPVGEQLGKISSGIDKTSQTITESLDDFSKAIKKTLEPISSFTGSTLGTLTGMLKDPLGSNGLGNVSTNLLNRISPGFGDKVNGTITNLNLQALANFPKQLFSSLDHLIAAVDNILAIPLNLLSQVYYGYMDIMKSISKLLSRLMNGFTDFFLNFLDSIIPVKSILDLLSQVSTLANQIGGIATTFLGSNQITGFANQVISFSSQISNVLNSPLDLVVSALPTQVNQYIYLIQNPQQIINNYLPKDLSQAFSKITSMTGFGFNGNMGFSLQSILQGTQKGVIRSILGDYAAQYNIIAPLLAGTSDTATTSNVATLKDGKYTPSYRDATKTTTAQYSTTQ